MKTYNGTIRDWEISFNIFRNIKPFASSLAHIVTRKIPHRNVCNFELFAVNVQYRQGFIRSYKNNCRSTAF